MKRTDVKVTSANSAIGGTHQCGESADRALVVRHHDERLRDDRLRDEPLFRDELRLRGTFAPFLRASESPMAIACLRLFTLPPWPLLPRLSVPCLRRRIALSTLLLAPRPYFRPPDFRRPFFAAMRPPGRCLRARRAKRIPG